MLSGDLRRFMGSPSPVLRLETVHGCVAEELLGPLQAGSRDVPGCSRAALQRPDTTTMGSLEGMINIGSSQWLSERFSDFPTAVQCVSGEGGLAAGCPWPPALSAAGSSCITRVSVGLQSCCSLGVPTGVTLSQISLYSSCGLGGNRLAGAMELGSS